MRTVPHLSEALAGLHPAGSHPCQRCGNPTAALANGRGRVDICSKCGTFELSSHDGLDSFTLRGLTLPPMKRSR